MTEMRFVKKMLVTFKGQHWTLCFAQSGNGLLTPDFSVAWLSAAAGMLISILLFILVRVLLSTRAEAQRLAEQLTVDLRESRTTLNLVLDTVPQAVYWKDVDGHYLGCNQTFATNCGFGDPAEVIGKTDYDLPWPEEDIETYLATDKCVLEENTPKLHMIEELQINDETRLCIDVSKVPLRNQFGAPLGILGVYEDITERRRAEDELAFKHAILTTEHETSLDGILVVDGVDGIISFNTRFVEMWGIPDEVLESQSGRLALEFMLGKSADPGAFI